MEPIEINAGAWYLRALRADDRMDDRPSLADLGERSPTMWKPVPRNGDPTRCIRGRSVSRRPVNCSPRSLWTP